MSGLKATDLATAEESLHTPEENRLRHPPHQRITIGTDYDRLSRTFSAAQEIPRHEVGRSAHPDIAEKIKVPDTAQFMWLKGHINIPGNDRADHWAKLGNTLPLVDMPSRKGDIIVYGAPMTGGFLKQALSMTTLSLPQYKRYKVKDCHPAISILKLPHHRICTLQQWKRGIVNLAGFKTWQQFTATAHCQICNSTQHALDVQSTITLCTGAWPTQWRQKFFQLFPADWSVQNWFIQAPKDDQRRFLRTLPANSLISWLRSKNITVPAIAKAWSIMHKRWLSFLIDSKRMMVPTPCGPAGHQHNMSASARQVAVNRAQARQARFRSNLMNLPEVLSTCSVTQMSMTQFVNQAQQQQQPHHHHQLVP